MSETSQHSPDAPGYRSREEMLDRLEGTETEPVEQAESLDASPIGDRVRTASERIASFLERKSISRAHDQALEEYRDRDHSGYVNHVTSLSEATDEDGNALESQQFNKNLLSADERRTNRAELLDAGKQRLRAIGNVALDKAKSVGLITLGLGVMTYAAAEKQARVTAFKAGSRLEDRWSKRMYAKEVERFEKKTSKDNKKLDKQSAKDIKAAGKVDRKFERSMSRKVTRERWENRAIKVAEVAGEQYRSAQRKKAILGQFAIKAHAIGAATAANKAR